MKEMRLFSVATMLVLLALIGPSAHGSMPIEQVMRELQGRIYFAQGQYWTWPGCPCGQPAPNYPKDKFYGDLDDNPIFATQLIQSISDAFFYQVPGVINPVYSYYLNTPDGNLEGQSSMFPDYTDTDFPTTVGGVDLTAVTTNNYTSCFATLRTYVEKLNYVEAGGINFSNAATKSGNGYYTDPSNHDICGECKANASADWAVESWSSPSGPPGAIGQYYYANATETGPGSGVNKYGFEGQLIAWFDYLPRLEGGTANLYLKVSSDAYNGIAYFNGLGDLTPIVSADELFHQFSSTGATSNTFYISGMLADGEPTVGDCCVYTDPECPGQGWMTIGQDMVLAPKFHTDPDPMSCADLGCGSGSGSTCSEADAPGQVYTATGSLFVRISLGRDQFGKSAGYFYIHEDMPSDALYTTDRLQYSLSPSGTTGMDGTQPMFDTPNIHAEIVPSGSAAGYTINFTNKDMPAIAVSSVSIYQTNSDTNQFVVVEQLNGGNRQILFNYSQTSGTWTMTKGSGLVSEARTTARPTSSSRIDTIIFTDNSGNEARRVVENYTTFPWGDAITQRVVGTNSTPQTNSWVYYGSTAGLNIYGQVQQMTEPSGRWEKYTYDSSGRLTKTVAQFGDNAPTTSDSANWVTQVSYDTTGCTITTVKSLLGTEVSRNYEVHNVDTYGIEQIQNINCATAGAAIGASDNLINITWRTTDTWDIVTNLNVDGTMSLYTYALNSPSTGQKTTTVKTGVPNSSGNDIVDGVKRITIVGSYGETLSDQTLDIASGLQTDLLTYSFYDTLRRSYVVTYLDSTTSQIQYSCCGLDTTTDRDGVVTSYLYDNARRPIGTMRLGITVTNWLDAAGNILQTFRVGSGLTTPVLIFSASYDTNGFMLRETNALGSVTVHNWSTNSSGETVITDTNPDGGTRVSTYYQDGTELSVSGTAVAPLNYDYGVDSSGVYSTTYKVLNPGGSTTEWSRNYQDMLGRSYMTTHSALSGTPTETSYYNHFGQMTNTVDPDGVSTMYAYNTRGEQGWTILHINQSSTSIDWSGIDRISYSTNFVCSDHGTTVRRFDTYVWCTNSSTSNLMTTIEKSVDGLFTWNTQWNGSTPLVTVRQTSYDFTHGYRIATITMVDGSFFITTNQSDRLISITRYNAASSQMLQTTNGYDAFGRLNVIYDVRNGATTYYFNASDQVAGIAAPLSQITSNYFNTNDQIWKVTMPDGTSKTNEYYLTGLLARTYGSRTYPVAYGYDSQGRMTSMTNWSGFSSGAGARVTTWTYDAHSGLLYTKTYDSGSAGPLYIYTPAGRLRQREWARGTVTTYSNTPAGDPLSTTYSDGITASIGYGYDRRGRQTIITNGSVVCSLAYNEQNQVFSESYSGGPLDGISVTNGYDSDLRRTTLAALNSGTLLLQQTYSYDAGSRLQSVSDGTNSATYSYLANSPLVYQIAFAHSGTPKMTTTKSYDSLNRLTSVGSVDSSSHLLDSHGYSYNAANQRTAMTNADGTYWLYGYDSLGQIVSGMKHWSDGTVVAGQQFAYVFDDIGNRTSTQAGGDQFGADLRTASYSANTLNQYSSRIVPGAINIIGSANSSATVTVNDQPTYRRAGYYRKELLLNNGTASVYQSVTNLAVLNQGSSADIATTNIGNIYLPKNPEAFSYDADGNLTQDGRWHYYWDGENRLIAMTNILYMPTAAYMSLNFVYDYIGRRIQKAVCTNNGSAYISQFTYTFLYDEWKPLAILSPALSMQSSFMWGLDVAGSLHGAGVGGLLAATQFAPNSSEQFTCFDGNGNITALVDATTGSVTGQSEYGPFAEFLRITGTLSSINPFHFATKCYDAETGFIYFGKRYLNPSLGRWVSRDPIEESGGINQYAVAGNDCVNYTDSLGLTIVCHCPEAYFKQNGITRDMYSASGDTYKANPDASTKAPTGGDGLILWRMLLTSYTFTVQDHKVDQLKKHVTARKTIVNNALKANFTFGNNGSKIDTHALDQDAQKYFDQINDTGFRIACQNLSEIIFDTGNFQDGNQKLGFRSYDGIWVPGDWGYIRNLDYEEHPEHWRNGLWSGENVFHTGVNGKDEMFWGHFASGKHPAIPEKEWFDDIKNKWVDKDGQTGRGKPKWRERIDFPGVGLELQ